MFIKICHSVLLRWKMLYGHQFWLFWKKITCFPLFKYQYIMHNEFHLKKKNRIKVYIQAFIVTQNVTTGNTKYDKC